MTTLDGWLADHAINKADLDSWQVQYNAERLVIQVHSVVGTPAFQVIRYFAREPKYVFNPEYCRRGAALYGLHRAVSSMASRHRAVVVEGFSDTICCHKAGITEAVGAMGSYITNTQEALIANFAGHAVVLMDGDDTGEETARKVVKQFSGMPAIGVTIWGSDPSEFYARGGDLSRAVERASSMVGTYTYASFNPDLSIRELVQREGSGRQLVPA